jgi:hypothetical protein
MTTMQRLATTSQLIFYSLFPPGRQTSVEKEASAAPGCKPREIAGMDRFLGSGGGFEVFFPGGLPIAAPFMLFRLKRQGYSACSVKAADGGLYLRGRR